MVEKREKKPKKEKEIEVMPPAKVNDEHDDDEPSWYHYVIVIIGFFAIFAGIYFGFEYYESLNPPKVEDELDTTTYIYPYKVGNATYNLHFDYPTEELDVLDYRIDPNKFDVLNTINFTFVFKEYNGTDNGLVATTSTKLMRFFKTVYKFSFDEDNFREFSEVNCNISSNRNKVVIFDPYAEENGVFLNRTNGCIHFNTDNPQNIVALGDKFIWEIINE